MEASSPKVTELCTLVTVQEISWFKNRVSDSSLPSYLVSGLQNHMLFCQLVEDNSAEKGVVKG